MGKKLTAKTWLVISLILCFVSMAVSSVIQSSGGRVKVSELRLVDSTGHEVSALYINQSLQRKKISRRLLLLLKGGLIIRKCRIYIL